MKKIATILLTLTMLISTSGCLKRDNLENIDIYTTSYPIEYITNRLYGKPLKVSIPMVSLLSNTN